MDSATQTEKYKRYREAIRDQSPSTRSSLGLSLVVAAALSAAAYTKPTSDDRPSFSVTQLPCDFGLEDVHFVNETDTIWARIRKAANNPELLEEGEPQPSEETIQQITNLIRGAAALTKQPLPPSQVSVFFGEVNVSWRAGNQILRLASFPQQGRPPLLQTGSLEGPFGSYRSQNNPTAAILAEKLDALSQDTTDPETPPFLG